MQSTAQDATERLVRLKELIQILGISGTSIWRRCKEGDFPTPIKTGPGSTSWKLSEVMRWINTRQTVTTETAEKVLQVNRRGRKPKYRPSTSE